MPNCAGTIHPAQRRRPCARLRTACGITECTSAAAPARCPSRAAIPTPARTCLSLPRRVRPCKGAARRYAVAHPCQARPRRGLPAAGSAGWGRRRARDKQHGQAAATGRRLAAPRPAFINGGGCAAAVINQWKRLRRSEHLGGPEGRCQHGHPHAGCWCATCVLTPMPAAEAGRLGAALSAGFAAKRRSSAFCITFWQHTSARTLRPGAIACSPAGAPANGPLVQAAIMS